MYRLYEITNATKAQIVVFANALLVVLKAFDVPLTDAQFDAISLAGNAAFGLWIALTFQLSKKRV